MHAHHWVDNLNPILFHLGPVTVRWYGVMYLIGFILGYLLLRNRYKKGLFALSPLQTQDLITYLLAGMLVGARTVYVFVYNPVIIKHNFWNLFAVWQGGLSYHGAAIGFAVSMWLFGRKHKVGFLHLADNVSLGAGIGVFFGRMGNFINGELFGRVTDVPWGVIFPRGGGPLPRHPSQIYQGVCEGLLVFVAVSMVEKLERRHGQAPTPGEPSSVDKKKKTATYGWKRTGVMASCYVIFYGIARFVIEFFRQPDPQLGFYFGWITMGQILCLLMIVIGTLVLIRRIKKPIPTRYTID